MRTIKIAFGCNARQGKDTCAAMIKESYPHTRIYAFADPLHDLNRNVYSRLKIPYEKNRTLLQTMGDIGRNYDANHFVELLAERLRNDGPKNYNFVIITDVRYANEMKFCKENEFITIKVVNPRMQGAADGIEGHSSEAGLPNNQFHHVIINDGALLNLRAKIMAIVGFLLDIQFSSNS